MYSELFTIPFTHLTVKSYGFMLVIGFLAAVYIIRRLSKNITKNPELITSAALYSLIAGVAGARIFYVVHYFEQFRDKPLSVFAVWQGGLELLGGVTLAVVVIILYLKKHKQPVLQYLDILAIGLFAALAFGRIGCFLNGCCFGKPTALPWAVRFPYGSDAYRAQLQPDPARNRARPRLVLPEDFFGYYQIKGRTYYGLKPYDNLTEKQRQFLKDNDKLRCVPVHPTQLYSSMAALVMAVLLYGFWKRAQNTKAVGTRSKFLTADGCTFALMFVLYGPFRFLIEYLRDDNPFEHAWWIIYRGGTVSQNIAIYMTAAGIILMIMFQKIQKKEHKSS